MSRATIHFLKSKHPLRVGFLPESACAPLVYAQEAGLFAKYDLDVELRRETSSAELRDKVVQGALEAAHAPATLPFLTNLDRDSDDCACVCGAVLSLQGNAITISRQMWSQGVRDARILREQIYQQWGQKTFTFGVPSLLSSQSFLLRKWLQSGGILPSLGVRIVPIPPAQMFPVLKLGYIDGYCAGEPWTSLAVQAKAGVCVATSAELDPLHPEKVLMVRQSYASGRADEHERLIAALLEACAFCDLPENRPLLCALLSQPHYVNAPIECLEPGLVGPFEFGDHQVRNPLELTIFNRHQANEPSDEKAAWVISHLYELLEQNLQAQGASRRAPVLKNIFRREIFQRARDLVFSPAKLMDARTQAYAPRVNLSA
jgi:ABC-type nitrate/sulfonate/bicarbonate transport system substrate-binding protein